MPDSCSADTTVVVVYDTVKVTSCAPLLNLPTDALQIIPWTGVTNASTGTMPQDFWDWLGSIANTIVNGLITVGQLIYGGLIAIGNFFAALGEAIVAWGMALVGTFQAAMGQSINRRSRSHRLLCLNQSVLLACPMSGTGATVFLYRRGMEDRL